MKINIVMDKSYLQGSSKVKITHMCLQHQIIMPEVLCLEILTAKNKDRIKCFDKFPKIENPVALVPSVSFLIRREIKENGPCSPIDTQFIRIRYVFNNKLTSRQFAFDKNLYKSLDMWKKTVSKNAKDFIEEAIVIDEWFPELSSYNPGGSTEHITNAMNRIATDLDFIREIYSQLRDEISRTYNELWPLPDRINKKWILFRYIQSHLLADVEYLRKYGKSRRTKILKRLENERIDIDYCIIGSLSNGLATYDKTMGKFYKLLCPDKILIS